MRMLIFFVWIVGTSCFASEKVSLVVNDIRLGGLVEVVYGQILKQPYILGNEVVGSTELLSVNLVGVSSSSLPDVVKGLAESVGLTVEGRGGLAWIGRPAAVLDEVLVYRPRFRSGRYLADVVQGVTGARSLAARTVRPMASPGMAAGQGVGMGPGVVAGGRCV